VIPEEGPEEKANAIDIDHWVQPRSNSAFDAVTIPAGKGENTLHDPIGWQESGPRDRSSSGAIELRPLQFCKAKQHTILSIPQAHARIVLQPPPVAWLAHDENVRDPEFSDSAAWLPSESSREF
jgi:hypothetical protein